MIQSASPSIPPFAAASRGRGSPLPTPPLPPPSGEVSESASSFDPPPPPPPRPLPSSGAGRGMPRMQQQPVDKPQGQEENRFIRRQEEKKAAAAAASASASPPPASPRSSSQPKLSAEDAVKRALELLSAGDAGRGRSDNKGGKRQDNRRVPGRHPADGEDQLAMFLGDNAHGDRLEKRLGEEKMKIFNQAFEDAADNALPSPMEYAYLEAAHTNNMIEFEPEYNVNFGNPDIDEKPPMSLEDMLQKVKPFIIAYEGIQNQEEWEEAVKDVMARAPRMKEVIDMYSGPDVVTAKQQEEELQRVANTLPGNIPSSVKRFTDKTLLSLKNNPGWGFDKKCQFMDKFAREVSDLYKGWFSFCWLSSGMYWDMMAMISESMYDYIRELPSKQRTSDDP
uniref:Uncharacterized protein n=1 Tax=Leersia perrieri TaxID=77586 RepID=A0A0D9WSZ6_9ORYZ